MDILRGVVGYSSLSLFNSVVNICFQISVLLLLGINDFGVFAYILAVSQTIEGISNSQSWQGCIRFITKTPVLRNDSKLFSYFENLLKVDLINILIAVILCIFSVILFEQLSKITFLVMLLLLTLPRLMNIQIGLLRVNDSFITIVLIQIICSILRLISILIFYLSGSLTIEIVLFSYAFGEMLIAFLNFWFAYIKYKILDWDEVSISKVVKNKISQEVKRFQIITHSNASSVLAVRYIDELIIGILLSFEILGIYKLSKLAYSVLFKFVEPASIFIFPRLSQTFSKGELFFRDVSKLFLFSFIIFGFSVFFYVSFPFIELFISNFIPDIYINSLELFQIMIFAAILNLGLFYAHPLAISVKKEFSVLLLNIILGIIYLIFCYKMGEEYGAIGIAWTFVLYTTLSNIGRVSLAITKLK